MKVTHRISATVLLLLVCLPGCSQVDPKLEQDIKVGHRDYARGNLISAERILTRAITEHPKSPHVAEAYYVRGLVRLKDRKPGQAQSDFARALELAKRDDLKANCRVCLGSIAYENHDWARAYDYYCRAVDKLPHLTPTDWVYYRLGDAAQKTGKWAGAERYFARLIRYFPNTQAARLAQRRINCDAFTIQAGVFGNSANANKQLRLLEGAAFSPRREYKDLNGKQVQAIYIGKYDTFAQASRSLEQVKRVVPDAQIVP